MAASFFCAQWDWRARPKKMFRLMEDAEAYDQALLTTQLLAKDPTMVSFGDPGLNDPVH
jgi:hypothetical protein